MQRLEVSCAVTTYVYIVRRQRVNKTYIIVHVIGRRASCKMTVVNILALIEFKSTALPIPASQQVTVLSGR